MESLLKVRNINKEIKIKGKKKKLLDDVTFDIKAGEFVAIVGVSGAGKTTLLNVLSGYDNYSSGEIYLDNQDIAHNKGYYLDKISYVPQKEILHDHLALKKSLMYSAILRNPKKNKKYIEKNVDNTLGILELKGKENTLIKNLSGGERKRASIASELLSKPNILFLDEPTSGLDSNIEKKLMKTLKDITLRGQTILITAHTVSNLYLCDKIIFMSDGGKICFIGTYEESLKYFQVEEFVDIYEKLKNSEEAEKYQQKYKKIKWDKINKVSVKKVRKERISFFKEIYILAKRYVEIILNNKFFSFLLFAQAIIMGLAVIVVVSQDWFKIYDKAKILLFAFSCAAMWLGLFNSVQEIVKERNVEDVIEIEALREISEVYREKYKSEHIERLKNGKCSVETGISFLEVFSVYEKIIGHCVNISISALNYMTVEEYITKHEYINRIRMNSKEILEEKTFANARNAAARFFKAIG